ncbi:MAG: hypothetical protein K6G15_10500 [Desulfovibrio sp.]|nr:hypothetical protein [Desulfovibrio sp.]
MISTLHSPRKLSLVLIFFVSVFFCRETLAAQILPSDLHGECVPFLPYLEYTLDENGSLDIEALALQEKSLSFQPVRSLGFAPEAGTFWLRFTIGPLAEGAKPMEWLLSLGESLPGDPKLYIPEIQPQTGMQQWRIVQVTDRHILNLPEAGTEAKTCFIRLDGPPGLWFAPMLRSPHNAANNWGALARPAAVLVLAILLLLSILRCFSEKGQWRLWTVLFVGCALAAGYLGLPTLEKGHIGFGQFARVLAPGLALMLLPHVARHMMRTQYFSRIIDAQLIVLTLVGACVTLVPLVPGFSWTARFIELWPLVTIFFIPTALWALFLGIPASTCFLLICLLPPLFTAAGLLGLLSGLSADILAAFPLYGIAFSSLLLVATHNAPEPESKNEKNSKDNEAIMLKDQLDDPNLRIIAFDQPKPAEASKPSTEVSQAIPAEQKVSAEFLENLQRPVDLLVSEATHLEQCALPPAVRVHAKNMVDQAKRLWNLLKGTKESDNAAAHEEEGSCDLQIMMRDIYNHAMHVSNTQEIALGWYMPPEMPSLFQGKVRKLKQALELLVESSVRATTHGSIHFTVCPFPESEDPGHLLFSVTDTGSGMPPKNRSALALNMAWELVADLHGALTLQSSVQGTTINLAVHLTNLEERTAALCRSPLVLICSLRKEMCEQIQAILQGLPCRTRTCTNLDEALALCAEDPFTLLIAHEAAASAQAAPLIAKIRKQNMEAGLPFCKVLAITHNDLSWKELGEAGYTFALLEPLDEEALRVTVSEVIDDLHKTNKNAGEEQANSTPKSIPDLFGSGGAVPKDIEELTGLAKLIHTFSSLGKEMSEDKISSPAEHKSQSNEIPEGNDLLSPSSAPLSLDGKSASPNLEKRTANNSGNGISKTLLLSSAETKNTQNDADIQPLTVDTAIKNQTSAAFDSEPAAKSQDQATPAADLLSPSVPAQSESTDSLEQTQPVEVLTHTESPQEDETKPTESKDSNVHMNSEPTALTLSSSTEDSPVHVIADDEWVGEPVPVQKPSQAASEPVMSSGQSQTTPSEPVITTDQPQTTPQPHAWLDADEWVGEPVPVQKASQAASEPVMSSGQSQTTPAEPVITTDQPQTTAQPHAWLDADEWVGEPVPVQKPSQAASEPVMSSGQSQTTPQPHAWLDADEWVGEPVPVQKPSFTERQTETPADKKATVKEDHSVPHKGNWAANWEGERIPVLAEAEQEDLKASENKHENKQEETEDKSNVLDFIEGAVETDSINGTFVSLAEQKTPSSESTGIAPDPALLDLVRRLNLAVEDAKRALAASQSMRVAEAAGRIAAECDAFSFRILARIARCVEQAGKAKDLNALKDLLPELAQQVERNNIALTQIR